MTSDQSARAFLEDAQLIFEEAQASLKAGHHHRVVRKAQESAELALKGLFRYLGLEYPKSHVLGRVIQREVRKCPLFSPEEIEKLAYYSDALSLDREPAFYGTPDGIPASELFDQEDARESLQKADWILGVVRKIVTQRS